MKTEPIPVTLLTGFLGAGKTTYLNARLRSGIPAGSMILVNDFGAINIDAELIDYRDEQILRLSNGCICCTLGGSLAEQLAEVLRMEPAPAALYIEASGIADPTRIMDAVRVSPRLSLEEVVCLVDASQAERHARDPLCADVWLRQVRAGGRLVINRIGAGEPLPAVLAGLWSNEDVLVERQPGAASAPALTTRTAGMPTMQSVKAGAYRATPVGGLQSCSINFAGDVEGEDLERLLSQYADVLLRAKGILRRCGRAHAEVLQLAGSRILWSPAPRRASLAQLVCIGRDGERFAELVRVLTRLGAQLTYPDRSALRHPGAPPS